MRLGLPVKCFTLQIEVHPAEPLKDDTGEPEDKSFAPAFIVYIAHGA